MSGISISVTDGNIKIKITKSLLKRDTGLEELGSILTLLQNGSMAGPMLEALDEQLGKDLADEVVAYATVMEMTTSGFADVADWTKPVVPASIIPEEDK